MSVTLASHSEDSPNTEESAQQPYDLEEWADDVIDRADLSVEKFETEIDGLIDSLRAGVTDPGVTRSVDDLIDAWHPDHESDQADDAPGFMARARAVVGQENETQQNPLFVLTSFSIGAEAMRAHMHEASQMDRPVVFVIRGFDPDDGGLQGLVQQMLEVNKWEIDVEMHVNPVFFDQYSADRGPVFVLEGDDGLTRVRRGQVNLTFAEESLQTGKLDLVVGETVAISEPDLLAIIRERVENFTDGPQIVADAVERARQNVMTSTVNLPLAETDDTYWVDPSIAVNHDIKLPDGTIVAPAGTEVNPLDYAPWDIQVVVFDATLESHIDIAQQWRDHYSEETIFIATRLPQDEEDQQNLGKSLGGHINLLDDLVARRMDLRAIPSLVRQDGRNIRVEVAAPTDEASL